MAKVSIATERYATREGARVVETDWVTVTILNRAMAEWAAQHAKAGDEVYCECRVAEGSYQKDGRTLYTTEIIANVFDLYPIPRAAEVAS